MGKQDIEEFEDYKETELDRFLCETQNNQKMVFEQAHSINTMHLNVNSREQLSQEPITKSQQELILSI